MTAFVRHSGPPRDGARALPHRASRFVVPLVLVVMGAGLAGCRQAAQGFGTSVPSARQAADDLLGAFATRFTDVYRTPRFALARTRLARHALTPSRLVDDTVVWTSRERDGTRVLNLAGYSNGTRYVFSPSRDWPIPTRPGQSRHLIRLRPVGDGEYEWNTDVHQSLGSMPASALSDVFGGFFRAVEMLPEGALRSEARTLFPRSGAAWGRLFSIDTLRGLSHRDGGKSVTLVIGLHPDRLEKTLPAFAAYVKKYVSPARYDWSLREPNGTRWLEASADDDRLTMRFRVHDGSLQPFEGAPRRMPDALRLEGRMLLKIMIFEVGVSELQGEMTRVRTATEDGWRLALTQEPDWHLPLATRQLIRAPLRRPFEQGGTTVWLTLKEDGGGATHLSRGFRTVVKESAIVRWIGALGWAAASDFSGPSEEEENRFLAEGFAAMREDTREVLRGATAAGP